jgi:alkyl hydroperoxide reductase subunit D
MMHSNETVRNLLADLNLPGDHSTPALEQLAASDSRGLKDLKLNIGTVLRSTNMSKKEAFLLSLAAAVNERHEVLRAGFELMAKNEGATDAEIAETNACVAVMSANNVFYRFRHYMAGVEYYSKTPAGLRMTVMANPVLGKEFFELMSLAVSALNGCEMCVQSHESSVKQHGASEPRIYDAIRLVAVVKSLCCIL